MTEEGRQRLKDGGMEWAYLGEDGRVHTPGKRVTLYSDPSPPGPTSNCTLAEPVEEQDKQVKRFCYRIHLALFPGLPRYRVCFILNDHCTLILNTTKKYKWSKQCLYEISKLLRMRNDHAA